MEIMITFFAEVNKNNFFNLQRTLENNQGVILSNDSQIILRTEDVKESDCRDLVEKLFSKEVKLLVKKDNIKQVFKDCLEDGLTFMTNNYAKIPVGTLEILLSDYLEHPNAGFISGHFVDYPVPYKVKRLYPKEEASGGEYEQIIEWDKVEFQPGLNIVDTAIPYGMMTKSRLLKEWFGKKTLSGTRYGITLRKLGYQNYVDTRVKYKMEN